MLLVCSVCSYAQTITESAFFKKYPDFGRTKLAFTSEFSKLSPSEKNNTKKVTTLINEHVDYFVGKQYGSVKNEEKQFMYNYLSNVASEWVKGENEIREKDRREAEERAKAERNAEMERQRAEQKKQVANASVISTEQCVDLGLSVYWAGYNLGASSPEEWGNWYLWGDTESKYRQGNFNSELYTRDYYSDKSKPTYYDVVKQVWGNGWQSPSQQHIEELLNRCEIIQCKYKGVLGLKVVGPNGNSIFLPASIRQVHYLASAYHYYFSDRYRKNVISISDGGCLVVNTKSATSFSVEFGGVDRQFSAQIRAVKPKK